LVSWWRWSGNCVDCLMVDVGWLDRLQWARRSRLAETDDRVLQLLQQWVNLWSSLRTQLRDGRSELHFLWQFKRHWNGRKWSDRRISTRELHLLWIVSERRLDRCRRGKHWNVAHRFVCNSVALHRVLSDEFANSKSNEFSSRISNRNKFADSRSLDVAFNSVAVVATERINCSGCFDCIVAVVHAF